MRIQRLLQRAGAAYAVVATGEIHFDPVFRAACEKNACGFYGACWMCPPDAGEIGALIERARTFERALVFQSVYPVEDSFDIEGMRRAGRAHNHLVCRLRAAAENGGLPCFALGAGACGGCATCARRENVPCRHPQRAVIPLEAAGVDVLQLSRLAGLPYLNGKDTVTYFGAVFFNGAPEKLSAKAPATPKKHRSNA